MQHNLNGWSKRDLTPFGKVTVLNILIISKIVHLLIALPTPSVKIINEINKHNVDLRGTAPGASIPKSMFLRAKI